MAGEGQPRQRLCPHEPLPFPTDDICIRSTWHTKRSARSRDRPLSSASGPVGSRRAGAALGLRPGECRDKAARIHDGPRVCALPDDRALRPTAAAPRRGRHQGGTLGVWRTSGAPPEQFPRGCALAGSSASKFACALSGCGRGCDEPRQPGSLAAGPCGALWRACSAACAGEGAVCGSSGSGATLPSKALTVKMMRRPSTAVTSAAARTEPPTGVARSCVTLMEVPTYNSASAVGLKANRGCDEGTPQCLTGIAPVSISCYGTRTRQREKEAFHGHSLTHCCLPSIK